MLLIRVNEINVTQQTLHQEIGLNYLNMSD